MHHTQQHALQLQSIAHHHSVPLTYSTSASTMSANPSTPQKRSEATLATLTASMDDVSAPVAVGGKREAVEEPGEAGAKMDEPPKKKRRVALTRVGDLDP